MTASEIIWPAKIISGVQFDICDGQLCRTYRVRAVRAVLSKGA